MTPMDDLRATCEWCGVTLLPLDGTWTDPENSGDYCPEGLAVGMTGTSPHLPRLAAAESQYEVQREALDVERLTAAIHQSGMVLVDQVTGRPVDEAEKVLLRYRAALKEHKDG